VDGLPDACQIHYGFSADTDGDGVPDGCEGKRFKRGDANGDGSIDIGDAIKILGYLFHHVPITCLDTADTNDEGHLDIADPIFLLYYSFGRCGMIPPPYPACGIDVTADGFTCEAYNEDVNCAR